VTKLSFFSLLAVIILAAVVDSPAMTKEQPFKPWMASRAAHLHVAPSSQSPVVAFVPKNAVLTSLEPCARGWCAVQYKGIRGWIYDVYLTEQPTKTISGPTRPQPLAKGSLQKRSPAAVATAGETARISYRVIGLGVEESLPVREGPLETARMIGVISPAANAIAELETCIHQWCLIEHDGVRGFVQIRFLERLRGAPAPRYGVNGEANLKVFSFGGSDADVVGEIPFYAGGIVPVDDCNGKWCHIRYLGLVGFVDTSRLRPENAPQG
jgi:SH3-like domain-containing protein